MKLESTKSKHPQLVYEAKLYKILQGAVGWCGGGLGAFSCQNGVVSKDRIAINYVVACEYLSSVGRLQASPTSDGMALRFVAVHPTDLFNCPTFRWAAPKIEILILNLHNGSCVLRACRPSPRAPTTFWLWTCWGTRWRTCSTAAAAGLGWCVRQLPPCC